MTLVVLPCSWEHAFADANVDIILPVNNSNGEWYALTYPTHATYGEIQFSAVDFNHIDGSEGRPVYAIQDGVIDWVNKDDGTIVIKHTIPLVLRNGYTYKTWYSQYSHMKEVQYLLTDKGKKVKRGAFIGRVSNVFHNPEVTLVPHLHFVLYDSYDGDITNSISPYWLNGDYSKKSLYADDTVGSREGLYNKVPVYDAMIFREMPYDPSKTTPSLTTLHADQLGATSVDLYCEFIFGLEEPSKLGFIIWQEGGKRFDLSSSNDIASLKKGEVNVVTQTATSDDIALVHGETYFYHAYADFFDRTLLGKTRSFTFEQLSCPYDSTTIELPSSNFKTMGDGSGIWNPVISTTLAPKQAIKNTQNTFTSIADIYLSGNYETRENNDDGRPMGAEYYGSDATTSGPVYPPFSVGGETVSIDITTWENAPVKACYDANGYCWEYYYGEWHKGDYKIATLESGFHLMYYYGDYFWDVDCISIDSAESWYYSVDYGWESMSN